MKRVADTLGEVGLPEPVASLASRDWDAIVVGGGHNGLTAATYLARAGNSVLVLERRERLGGACTLERPFDDDRFVISPCAYVVGLLDEVVIRELGLRERGLRVFVADPNLWVPFEDGSSFGQWLDDERTERNLDELGVSDADKKGYWAYEELFDQVRIKLRKGARDTWLGDTPTRAEIEDILDGNGTMIDLVFEASIADVLDDHIGDERLKTALYGQGIIGTWGGPWEPGTASIKLMHYQGDLEGQGPVWGYVEGGIGMVSFAIADAARESGATLACGVPVSAIHPGEGVELEDGTRLRLPHRALQCGSEALARHARGLRRGPRVQAAARRLEGPQPRGQVQRRSRTAAQLDRRSGGDLARPGDDRRLRVDGGGAEGVRNLCRRRAGGRFGEIYIQTGYDPTPAPEGKHLLSVFGQYAPYEISDGDWDSRRDDVAKQFIDLISRFAPDLSDCLIDHEVLGPPDIEERIGLTGGNIFQGEVTPDQMWEGRLSARTPVPGLYLCGAATHPAGSVIGLNGRNAAEAVLADAGVAIGAAA